MKVKVIKCTDSNAWYRDKTPFEIEVESPNSEGNFYFSAILSSRRIYILKSDCEIIEDSEQLEIPFKEESKCHLSKSNETIKNDSGKPQYSDLPVKTLRSVTKAFNYGASKYSKFNYTKGLDWLRYSDACMRHLEAWRELEDIDVESNSHHIDNAIASLMMLRENIHLNKGKDNRNQDYK